MKYTPELKKEIRRLYVNRVPLEKIAKKYNLKAIKHISRMIRPVELEPIFCMSGD